MTLLMPNDSKLTIPPTNKLILPPDPSWAPLYYTKPLSDISRGDDIADFTATAMTAERGFRENQKLLLTPWQRWALQLAFEEKSNGKLRHRQFLLGIPKKNGKSMLASAIALEALFYGGGGRQIYSAAKNRDQAKVVFNFAKRQVGSSPVLDKAFRCYRDAIENRSTKAIYKAIPADAGSQQGLGPYILLIDELHSFNTPMLWDFFETLKASSVDQAESLAFLISTSGVALDSLLGSIFEAGVALSNSDEPYENSLGMAWWGLPEDADIYDEANWMKANPNLAEGLYSWDAIRGLYDQAVREGKMNSFRRYHLNQWVRSDDNEMYVSPFYWKKIENPEGRIEKGRKITVGFDGSLSEDSTGFVGIDLETGLMEVLACWSRDYNDPNWVVPRDEVLSEQTRIFAEYDVQKMWCDDAFFQTDVLKWAKQYRGKIERIPQSNGRLVPMTEQLKIDIISGEVSHNGDKLLRSHFMNACLSDNGRIYKEARGSKNKIDLAVCAILANGARNRILRRGKAPGRAIVLS